MEIFLSLTHQVGGVSFYDGEKGFILKIGKIGRIVYHSIDNVHYGNCLKYNLLNISQFFDNKNKVKLCLINVW